MMACLFKLGIKFRKLLKIYHFIVLNIGWHYKFYYNYILFNLLIQWINGAQLFNVTCLFSLSAVFNAVIVLTLTAAMVLLTS